MPKPLGNVLIDYRGYFLDLATNPQMRDTRKKIINKMKRILATAAAPEATPPKPKIPAIIAMIKNIKAQYNIHLS